MRRYVDEFTFRLNDGNVRRHTWDRLDSFVSAVAVKRLTYERLMSEARPISTAARAALWRALVTARQIEKLVRPRTGENEITRGNAIERWIQQEK